MDSETREYPLEEARLKLVLDTIKENKGIILNQKQYKDFTTRGLTRKQIDQIIHDNIFLGDLEITVEDGNMIVKPVNKEKKK